jgi:hypothetical protein
MQPYVVELTAYGRPFATVVLEVGYDEFGATSDGSADTLLPDEIADMFVWGRQTPALRIGRGIDSLPGRVRPHGGSQVQPTSMATRSSGLG